MRKPMVVMLGLLAAGVAAAAGYYAWKSSKPREIGVCIVTDYAFRQRSTWEDVVVSRFKEVNRIFAPAKIQWRILTSGAVDPTAAYPGLDQRRALLGELVECSGGAVVAITGVPEGKRGGSTSPFARAAVVVDLTGKSEPENVKNMAHVLAGFFGAPQEPAGSGTLMTEPPESSGLSDKSAALLRSLRNYNLAAGIAAMTPEFDGRATNAIANAVSGLPGKPLSIAHRAMAVAWANEHKMEQAVAHLREAVTADPANALAHGDLASGLMQRSETGEALKEIREALRLDPANAALHAAYAGVLARMSDPEGAIDEARRSIEISPDNPLFQVSLASICLQEPGYIDDAIAAYEDALKLDPTYRLAEMGLERARGEKNKANDDAGAARRLTQQNPSSGAFFLLGAAETRAGNLNAAAAALQKGVEMDPKNGRAQAILARVQFLRKDYKGAWSAINGAQAANFETPSTLVKALERRQPRL